METPDPWRLADKLGATVKVTEICHARAYTDGEDTIWLCHSLTPVQARCSLYHEIVHIIFGHSGRQDDRTEAHVRATVARDLIPWPNLIRVAATGHDLTPHYVADQLNVTPGVLRDRLHAATPRELADLRKATQCTLSVA